MRLFHTLIAALGLCLALTSNIAAADSNKLSGTRFEMEVPTGWAPGYKDLDNLLMLFFKDAKSGATLEGVYLRKVQGPEFSMEDFKKWRIGAEAKRYDGKDFKVDGEGGLSIGGATGNYLHTTWNEGGKPFEKHTGQYLKDGGQYMVVLWGEKGKVDKAVFDHAVKTFGLAK